MCKQKAEPILTLPLLSDNLIFWIFPELIWKRDENKLGMCFSLSVPLPEVIKQWGGKQWITDVTRPITVDVKADREEFF